MYSPWHVVDNTKKTRMTRRVTSLAAADSDVQAVAGVLVALLPGFQSYKRIPKLA